MAFSGASSSLVDSRKFSGFKSLHPIHNQGLSYWLAQYEYALFAALRHPLNSLEVRQFQSLCHCRIG